MAHSEEKIARTVYVKNGNGIIYGKKEFSFSGDLVSAEVFVPTKKEIYCYNEFEQITDVIFTSYMNIEKRITYKYDKKYRLIETCTWDENDLISTIDRRHYENDKDYIEYYVNPSRGYARGKMLYQFNEHNQLVCKRYRFSGDLGDSEERYEYDCDGNILRKSRYSIVRKKDKLEYERIYTYNQGKIVHVSHFYDQKLSAETFYKYNTDGKVILEIYYDYHSYDMGMAALKPKDELIDYNPNIRSKISYEYDSPFRFTKYVTAKVPSGARDGHTMVRNNKYLIELYQDSLKTKVVYYYDPEGIIFRKTEYQYNEYGNITLTQTFPFSGNLLEMNVFQKERLLHLYDEYDLQRMMDED